MVYVMTFAGECMCIYDREDCRSHKHVDNHLPHQSQHFIVALSPV